MFSLFQKVYSFKGVVFSNSTDIKEFGRQHNISVISDVAHNAYNMPYVNEMLLSVYRSYNASFYGFLNSDVLMNPRVFSLLSEVSNQLSSGAFPSATLLASRVRNTISPFKPRLFDDINSFQKKMDSCPKCRLRSIHSSVGLLS